MKQNRGKRVDIKGINCDEIDRWLKSQPEYKEFIRCQTLVSLAKGVPMNVVSEVLNVNRESARRWKQLYRKYGVAGLLISKKKGKASFLNKKQKDELTKIINSSPLSYGYDQLRWTGNAFKKLVNEKWGISISVRTAQVWIKSFK